VAVLREAGVRVDVGLCREEAVRANAAFFKRAATGRPLVTAKWAMTADGKTATRTGSSRWISGTAARRLVHQIRGVVDCVAVGSRTAQRDDPLLTCRLAEPRRTASRLVLCGRGCPPADSRLVTTCGEAPVLLAYPEAHPPDGLDALLERGCEALPVPAAAGFPRRVAPAGLLDELGRRDMSNVLLEGGAEVLGSFFDAGQVDRTMVFVAPKIAGGEGAVTAVGARGVERMREALPLLQCAIRTVGPDVLMEGWVRDPLQWLPED
jgi:diaminohydroxyphosphoribosylaminopyrimidine deaminase/5-amino-6-(5-phosphoribosylamino)uracil reductase